MTGLEDFTEVAENHEQELQAARNSAQVELAEGINMELGDWISKFSSRFDEILIDSPSMLEDLLDKNTHTETIEEIRARIYN